MVDWGRSSGRLSHPPTPEPPSLLWKAESLVGKKLFPSTLCHIKRIYGAELRFSFLSLWTTAKSCISSSRNTQSNQRQCDTSLGHIALSGFVSPWYNFWFSCRQYRGYMRCLGPIEENCSEGIDTMLSYDGGLRTYLLKMDYICNEVKEGEFADPGSWPSKSEV